MGIDMKRMVCKSCGGALTDISRDHSGNRWRCEYCGAEYVPREVVALSGEKLLVEMVPARCETLRVRQLVKLDYIHFLKGEDNANDFVDFIKRQMVGKLAEAIFECADFVEEPDLYNGNMRYTATVRIVKKGVRFGADGMVD